MSRKSTPSIGGGTTEHVGTAHIPSNATPSADNSAAGLYDKWKKVKKTFSIDLREI